MSIRVQNPNGRVKIDVEGGDPGDCGDYVGAWVTFFDSFTGLAYDSIAHENVMLSVSSVQPSIAPGTLSISANAMPSTSPYMLQRMFLKFPFRVKPLLKNACALVELRK